MDFDDLDDEIAARVEAGETLSAEMQQAAGAKERPLLIYFPHRGRAESIRLTLAYAGVDWKEPEPPVLSVTDGDSLRAMHNQGGTVEYPFGQVPIFDDGTFRLSQGDAILRHLGRVHDLYGDTLEDKAMIDMAISGCFDMQSAYDAFCYGHGFTPGTQIDYKKLSKYIETRLEYSSAKDVKSGGAHFAFLDSFLARNGGKFMAGKRLSIADILLFSVVHVHLLPTTKAPDLDHAMRKLYKGLCDHHDMIQDEPKIADYLKSGKCYEKANG
eukprot:TRINITY_DN11001_c0_g1_i1.p1 TRINITY_DN11001_c0_g1~~TRINITY_DN11001_c0_g1_i1.p1  ORF type:complete len:290 (-),score=46.49 TRINITY_DN11001_c0_g1_i1:33-842(-)